MKQITILVFLLFSLRLQAQINSTPVTVASDGKAVELGLKFKPMMGYQLNGVWVYKADTAAGWTVTLWDTTGFRIYTAQLVGRSKGQVFVPFPWVTFGTSAYMVSVFSPLGNYGYRSNYFTADSTYPGFTTTKGAGTYRYATSSSYPNQVFQNTYYYVAPVMAPMPQQTPSVTFHDTVTVYKTVLRDTCYIKPLSVEDWLKVFDDKDLVVAVDSSGYPIMPDGTRMPFRQYHTGPIVDQFVRSVYKNGKWTNYQYTMYQTGAWTMGVRQADGSYLITNYNN